jgi:predicted transcriptional regulator
MSKMELFSTKEVAKKIGITEQAVRQRFEVLGIRPYKHQGNKGHYWDRMQIHEIHLMFEAPETNKPIVYIVHKHTQEIIIESKINKKSAVYGTHRRNQYKKV